MRKNKQKLHGWKNGRVIRCSNCGSPLIYMKNGWKGALPNLYCIRSGCVKVGSQYEKQGNKWAAI